MGVQHGVWATLCILFKIYFASWIHTNYYSNEYYRNEYSVKPYSGENKSTRRLNVLLATANGTTFNLKFFENSHGSTVDI